MYPEKRVYILISMLLIMNYYINEINSLDELIDRILKCCESKFSNVNTTLNYTMLNITISFGLVNNSIIINTTNISICMVCIKKFKTNNFIIKTQIISSDVANFNVSLNSTLAISTSQSITTPTTTRTLIATTNNIKATTLAYNRGNLNKFKFN
jgi:hypothetical protein